MTLQFANLSGLVSSKIARGRSWSRARKCRDGQWIFSSALQSGGFPRKSPWGRNTRHPPLHLGTDTLTINRVGTRTAWIHCLQFRALPLKLVGNRLHRVLRQIQRVLTKHCKFVPFSSTGFTHSILTHNRDSGCNSQNHCVFDQNNCELR